MIIFVYFMVGLVTFFLMEAVAWFTHKYVMHGLFWFLHVDHHKHKPGFFEKNDLFFLIFALPSWLSIMFGLLNTNYFLVSIGVGIAIYGFCYFLVHDVFIHQRFKWFTRTDNVYFRALRKAHKIHHKHQVKEGGSCFGMLIVPKSYFDEARKSRRLKHKSA